MLKQLPVIQQFSFICSIFIFLVHLAFVRKLQKLSKSFYRSSTLQSHCYFTRLKPKRKVPFQFCFPKVFLQIKGRIRVNVIFITFYLSTSLIFKILIQLKWLYQNLMLTKASYITYLAFYPTYTEDSDDHLYCNLIQLEWLCLFL